MLGEFIKIKAGVRFAYVEYVYMKKCETCDKEIIEKYGSGRFCSSFCARKFSTIAKRADINKIARKKAIERIKNNENNEYNGFIKPRTQTIKKHCPICGNEFESWKASDRTFCSRECMDKDVKYEFRVKPPGGYRKNSGRSKNGYYRGVWCQSTYELAFVIYNLDNNIYFTRNTKGYSYVKDGSIHKYFPDFLQNGDLIETKGYYTPDVKLKSECVNLPLKILYRKDLEYAFSFIKEKYGKTEDNIFELYDGYKPSYSYLCCKCKKPFSCSKKRKTDIVFCSKNCSGEYRADINHFIKNKR